MADRCARQFSKPRMPRNELMIKSVPFHQQRAPCLEERQIAVDLDRQVQIRKIGASADEPAASAGLRKLIKPASRSGLIAMILAPRRLAVSSADSIAGGWSQGSGRPRSTAARRGRRPG